jgi:signal transduction histidine kinase/CheY-like chemotaxis protein
MDLKREIEDLRNENQRLRQEFDNAIRLVKKNKTEAIGLTEAGAAEYAAKTSQERYMDLLLENCRDIILIFDQKGRLVYCTDVFLKQAGNINIQLADDQTLENVVFKAVNENQPITISGSIVYGNTDERRDYSVDVTPLVDSNKQAEGVMIFFHDLTDVLIAKALAEEASQAKTYFIASVSHEIRTPMNAILGIANMLKRTDLNDVQRAYLLNIQNSSHSLLGLVNDILNFSKIEAGSLSLTPGYFDLRSLLLQNQSMFEILCWQKNLPLICDFDESLPKVVFGDDLRIGEIISNILNNAVKYTAVGYIRFCVYPDENSNIFFVIQDTGIGIKDEALPRLFTAFEQLSNVKNKNVSGTGLGLTIARHLCELMGGEITVTSQYGRGSTFTVRIPLKAGQEDDLEENSNIVRPFQAPQARVLLVDDIEINLIVAASILEECGIKSDQASSGPNAIELFKNNHYDLIFMDHMMPVMDGIETTEHIRELGEWGKKVPIIALTANVVPGAAEMFTENGLNDFLPKPIDLNEIASCILRWLPAEMIRYEDSAKSGE